jgi:WD40 repeat protein
MASASFRPVVSASLDHSAKVWDAETGHEIVTFTGHPEKVTSATFSPDGKHVASSGADGMTRLWDVSTAAELAVFEGQSVPAFDRNGMRLVWAGSDFTVNIWKLIE